MEQSASIQKVFKVKPVRFGPHLPQFSWRVAFPDAELVYLADRERASSFLEMFGDLLYRKAVDDGDVVIGFDIEWRSREKGQSTSSNDHRSDVPLGLTSKRARRRQSHRCDATGILQIRRCDPSFEMD